MALQIGTVLPITFRPKAVRTVPAAIAGEASHDLVSDLEVLDAGAEGDDGAGAFMRCRAWELGAHCTYGYHAVGVAVGCDCYFQEEVIGGKGFRCEDRVDFVGFVELVYVSFFLAGY